MSQIVSAASAAEIKSRIADLQKIALSITNDMMPKTGTKKEIEGLKERLFELTYRIQELRILQELRLKEEGVGGSRGV